MTPGYGRTWHMTDGSHDESPALLPADGIDAAEDADGRVLIAAVRVNPAAREADR
jgi:hypothetical protein